MTVTIDIPKYDKYEGLVLSWVEGFNIDVEAVDQEVTIFANREGLLSLAKHLLTLADENVPPGHHFHFSEDAGLAEGSIDLVIGKSLT